MVHYEMDLYIENETVQLCVYLSRRLYQVMVDLRSFRSKMLENSLSISLGFGGGAELLVGNKKNIPVTLPINETQWTIGELLNWIKDNLLEERSELFIQDNSVRPGILVLINDVDWELMDTINYTIQPQDQIVFISTLHGG
ncbi:hypothetical protein FQA39_LY08701 [Lamprigera yunnana]|nr:hypothetical protein FQA39_LY08701 [Lamprigera yunnana]